MDPDSTVKDPRISHDFKIECYFRDFCTRCVPSMSIDELCKRCVSAMKDEVQSWRIIKNILDVGLINDSCYYRTTLRELLKTGFL